VSLNEKEPEVFNIPEEGLGKRPNSHWKKTLAIVLAIASAIYDFSPIDLMPLLPFDNLGLTGAALLNLAQQFVVDQESKLVKILKYAKWIFVILVVIAFLLFGGVVALLMNLMMR
jgi:hypothetical protein